jgi:hypothetical protein
VAKARHQQRKVVILIALKDSGANPAMLASYGVRLVEKHCLSDTTQSVQDKAPSGLTSAKTLERNPEILDLGIATD